jgi:hypothetical protein
MKERLVMVGIGFDPSRNKELSANSGWAVKN